MADDLDDLFGAFDGDDGDDAENDEPSPCSSDRIKSSPSHEKKGASSKESAAKGVDDDEEEEEDGGNAGEKEEEEEEPPVPSEADAPATRADDDERDGGAPDGRTPLGDADDEPSDESLKRREPRPPAKSNSTVSAKSYTDVMSRPTAAVPKKSSYGDGGGGAADKGSSPDETKKTKEEEEEHREVSTGTSHDKSIRSYSAFPDNYHPSEPPSSAEAPKEPAKTYPFPLDPFQSTAVSYIDKNESVLVAAHTSAGKTAVAEYAVAKSLRDGQRVIYTSPIKALSNQKYRDLQEEFDDVGLMTGDITINPTATALVMTTEILRSMLYRGSEVMREVAWVIYDEVHYMRDKERGVVWEESIILLPHKVRFVFLSATIPNASQFVDWICKVHHQPCHVVYTNYRPVPLQHYIFPQGGDGLHLVVDERGKFREGNFQRAMATLQSGSGSESAAAEAMLQSGNAKGRGGGAGAGQKRKRSGGGGGKKGQSSDLHRIVKLVMDRGLNPVIVFSFSKKDCERYALELNREDYTDDVEKDLVTQVYTNAIEGLGEDDRKLPQVEALLPLLKRGIGIHHGGLLPILKEIVEILFSEGLIKALFATETFAIGINMPAKTVVFTNTRKWDGRDFRWLTSGEYIQMSGRAGRRGKDDRGIVIQMLDEKMEPDVCKGILYGDPDPLNSSYRISYNMLLNMMRVEDVDPEYLLRASFHQYQQESEAPALEAKAKELEAEAREVTVGDGSGEVEERVAEYYHMDQRLAGTKRKMTKIVRRPEHILPFVQAPGRLLDITVDGENFGWGTLVSYRKRTATSGGEAGRLAAGKSGPTHSLDVLLPCVDRHFDSVDDEKVKEEDLKDQPLLWRVSARNCRPVAPDDDPKLISPRIFTVGLDAIERISAVRIYIPQDVMRPEPRETVSKSVKEVQRRFPEGLPLLDPVKDLGIKGEEFGKLLGRAEELASRLADHPLAKGTTEDERIRLVRSYGRKADLLAQARAVASEARSCQTMVMKDDLKKMKRVLKKLGHVDVHGVIQTKGRTACEINTSDELVAVELMFGGIFNDLSVEQSVALLSCMTYDEKVDDNDPAGGLKSYLANPLHKLKESARVIAKATIECKVELDEDEFVEKFNPGMMEAVFAWCKGAKFIDVQKLTGSFEGTTIRTLRRLEELVRQLTSASKAIGNHELQAKFEKGSELLKRDIVFCSSLYL